MAHTTTLMPAALHAVIRQPVKAVAKPHAFPGEGSGSKKRDEDEGPIEMPRLTPEREEVAAKPMGMTSEDERMLAEGKVVGSMVAERVCIVCIYSREIVPVS
jgi:hypothetical protein